MKSLKPFDEMVLGAVLAKATELHQADERDFWLCNLNKKDFDPTNQPSLSAEYATCALEFLASFVVPT